MWPPVGVRGTYVPADTEISRENEYGTTTPVDVVVRRRRRVQDTDRINSEPQENELPFLLYVPLIKSVT